MVYYQVFRLLYTPTGNRHYITPLQNLLEDECSNAIVPLSLDLFTCQIFTEHQLRHWDHNPPLLPFECYFPIALSL